MNAQDRIPEGYAVALARDGHYARYHPELRKGAKGTVAPPFGVSAQQQDRFVRVHFNLPSRELACDVQWFDLEVTDERWIRMKEEEARARAEAIEHHVLEARLRYGPKKGFLRLEVSYDNARPDDVFTREQDCAELIAELRGRGLLREFMERAK